jgi:hypothetical protein
MSHNLPDQWRTFLDNLQLPSGLVRSACGYCLQRLLVETGELGPDLSAPPRPDISPAQEAMVLDHLRWLLKLA